MPSAAELLRLARTRAGLSQRALARKAGTVQSVIARIERGLTNPTWATLERLLAAAGEGPTVASDFMYEVPGILAMTPEHRLQGVENVSDFLYQARRVLDGGGVPGATRPLNLKLLFTTLARHKVQYVLIGALGATLHGFPLNTRDADITPATGRDNLERLAAALRELDARIHTESVPEGLPFDCSARMLERAIVWNLITTAGRLDLAFEPSGTKGFDDLARHAVRFELYGTELLAARLEDIIRSKEATGRPKDRLHVEVMREMLKRNLR